jgi:hypothetical protein
VPQYLLGDSEPAFMARRLEASGNRDFRPLRKLEVIRGLEDMLSRALSLDKNIFKQQIQQFPESMRYNGGGNSVGDKWPLQGSARPSTPHSRHEDRSNFLQGQDIPWTRRNAPFVSVEIYLL